MIKQLLDAAMTDIKLIQSRQIISSSGKSWSDITCLDLNLDISILSSSNCLLFDNDSLKERVRWIRRKAKISKQKCKQEHELERVKSFY